MTAKPKAKAAIGAPQTAVAADRFAWYEATATYTPWGDDLARLPRGATDEARIANIEKLEKKIDHVQKAIEQPGTLPESIRDAKKRLRYLRRELKSEKDIFIKRGATAVAAFRDIAEEEAEKKRREKELKEWIKYDKKQERARKKADEKADAQHRKRLPPSEVQLRRERDDAADFKRKRGADQTAVAATAAASSQQPLPARSSEASTDGQQSAISESSGDDDELRGAVDKHVRMLASRSVSRRC